MNHIFYFSDEVSKWMLWSIDSRTMLQTYNHELLVDIVRTAWLFLLTFSPAVRVFLNFDVIVPLLLFPYCFFVVVLKNANLN